MKSLILALLPLVSLTAAAPPCWPTHESYTATYDDLEDGAVPLLYEGLTYTTFQVDQYDGFIKPTSGDKWAIAYGGSGNISVLSGEPKQTFELDSFSYACSSGVPQPECQINVWGHKANGKVIYREVLYPALGPAPVDAYVMNRTTFSKEWRDLKSVGFSIQRNDNGGDMFGGLALDDVKYSITEKC